MKIVWILLLAVFLVAAAVSMLNIACFFAGARIGQKAGRGEEIRLPVPKSPLQAHRERSKRKEEEMEQDRMEVILNNIERYDGTENGQEDVPGSRR